MARRKRLYVLPRQVRAPMGRISNLRVIYDGGTFDPNDVWSGWSAAIVTWDLEPNVLVTRWNDDNGPPSTVALGFPVLQGGHPGWHVVPDVFKPAFLDIIERAPKAEDVA